MKKYIKPNTEIHEIELQQMIAGSNPGKIMVGKTTSTEGFESLGKETEMSSGSIWGEEE